MNYQSIGSSGGIKQIKAKTVDFGATDAPVKFEDLEKDGMVQFPAIIGGVVPVINVQGIKPNQLKLDGVTLADIFQGTITNWNDKRIALLNPGLNIPAGEITVVHRADGSGTTAIFTDYLAKVSSEWKSAVGAGAAVKWPASSSVGGKGNEGVAANVNRVKNSIGYVEYAYTKKNNMTTVMMKNKEGQFIAADDSSFAAAAAGTGRDEVAEIEHQVRLRAHVRRIAVSIKANRPEQPRKGRVGGPLHDFRPEDLNLANGLDVHQSVAHLRGGRVDGEDCRRHIPKRDRQTAAKRGERLGRRAERDLLLWEGEVDRRGALLHNLQR
jgi:hypothetical protein